jgi:hypothetical protein
MGTNNIAVSIFDSPEEAPNFEAPEYQDATIDKFNIVLKGTKEGNSTVDVEFTGPDGQKYIAMITGRLVNMVNSAIIGAESR